MLLPLEMSGSPTPPTAYPTAAQGYTPPSLSVDEIGCGKPAPRLPTRRPVPASIRGALVTMPHKVATVGLLDEAALAVQVAGSCNAVLRRPDGSLYGELFDGIGFVRGAKRKGFDFTGADCLIVGAGGVGSAIAAAIAAEAPGSIALCDIHAAAAQRLAARLRRHFPSLTIDLRDNDPAGYHWRGEGLGRVAEMGN
jgi:hypothetical protein